MISTIYFISIIAIIINLATATIPSGANPIIKIKCTPANSLFGVTKKHLGATLSLRGGEVLKPSTLEDLEGIILKASFDGKLVVIDFSATWCGPCKMIEPMYHLLSDQMPDVIFVTVDVDEVAAAARKYSVSAMPTFIVIKKGEVKDKFSGADIPKLTKIIENLS